MVTGAKNDVEDANTTVKGSKGRACSLAALTDTQGQNATHVRTRVKLSFNNPVFSLSTINHFLKTSSSCQRDVHKRHYSGKRFWHKKSIDRSEASLLHDPI
jgi:hypothetical protein